MLISYIVPSSESLLYDSRSKLTVFTSIMILSRYQILFLFSLLHLFLYQLLLLPLHFLLLIHFHLLIFLMLLIFLFQFSISFPIGDESMSWIDGCNDKIWIISFFILCLSYSWQFTLEKNLHGFTRSYSTKRRNNSTEWYWYSKYYFSLVYS